MPYPENVATALRVEEVVRANGAVPATIGIVAGVLTVGLSHDEIETIGKMGAAVQKTSRRDLPSVVAAGGFGATTVSGTMIGAHMAGIRVFATGGIGGVHRGAETTMDVSADLTELGRTPVAVVCAGVKSLLDIGRTLEVLETQGVPVVTLGSTRFPAFFTRDSGFASHLHADSEEQVAAAFGASLALGLQQGMVVAVPVPREHEAESAVVEEAIQLALREADAQHVSGAEITPFLLKRVNELTKGQSLKTNIALVLNNAATAARIAAHMSSQSAASSVTATAAGAAAAAARAPAVDQPALVVVGASAVDRVLQSDKPIQLRTSNPGHGVTLPGGVARNVAEAAQRVAASARFCALVTVLGDDAAGRHLADDLRALGVGPAGSSTAQYVSVADADGSLVVAVADMAVNDTMNSAFVAAHRSVLAAARCVVADANLTGEALAALASQCRATRTPLCVEPVSVPKSVRIVEAGVLPDVMLMKPSVDELLAIARAACRDATGSMGGVPPATSAALAALGDGERMRAVSAALQCIMAAGVHVVLVSAGALGVFVCVRDARSLDADWATLVQQWRRGRPAAAASSTSLSVTRVPAVRVAHVVNTNGAGDTLLGVTLSALLHGATLRHAVRCGVEGAALCLQAAEAVPPTLTPALLMREYPESGRVPDAR